MQLTVFDNYLWRVNGILIALVCSFAFILMGFAGYEIYKNTFRERSAYNVANVSSEDLIEQDLSLNDFREISGSQILYAALTARQGYQQGYYSKSASGIRNYYFYDVKNHTGKWLLEDNSSLFIRTHELLETVPRMNDQTAIVAHLYEVITRDSDNNNKLTINDERDLLFYNFTLSDQPLNLISASERIIDVQQISSEQALIFFVESSKNYVVTLSIKTGKLTDRTEIAKIQS